MIIFGVVFIVMLLIAFAMSLSDNNDDDPREKVKFLLGGIVSGIAGSILFVLGGMELSNEEIKKKTLEEQVLELKEECAEIRMKSSSYMLKKMSDSSISVEEYMESKKSTKTDSLTISLEEYLELKKVK